MAHCCHCPSKVLPSTCSPIYLVQGFSGSLLTFGARHFFAVGACPMHCRMFCSVSGFCLLNASSIPLFSPTRNGSRYCHMSPVGGGWGGTIAPRLETTIPSSHDSRVAASLFRLCVFLQLCSLRAHILCSVFYWGYHLLILKGRALYILAISPMSVWTCCLLPSVISELLAYR